MEPITSWSEERVGEWLKGLDAPLHQYPVSEWHLSGLELLQLTCQDLEKLGVNKIGHQELILEAVEKLCSLTYGISGENLRSLTEKLRAVAHTLQMGIQGRWRLNSYDGRSASKLPAGVLQTVVELIVSAKGLFSLLNRYQFSQLGGYTASKNIFTYCRELGDIVHKDTTVYEKEKDIISVCRQLVSVCDEILKSSPEALLTHTAQLESFDLVPVSPGDQLFPCPDGGPKRRTCNNPLQSSRISGPSESRLGPGTLWLSSQYLYNMLHASFGFNIHAEAKGCFGKTRSHTPQM